MNKGNPTYTSWGLMKQRCLNPAFPKFPRYGGRGIRICERWIDSFANFLSDMGERPPGMTLHRVDNDGDYEPGNCEWATRSTQARNTRNTRLFTYQGKTQSLWDWADEFKIKPSTLWNRLSVFGWTFERAISEPVNPPTFTNGRRSGAANHKSHLIEFNGRQQSIREIASQVGMSDSNLRFRLKRMSLDEAIAKPVRQGVGGARQ